MTAGLWSRGCTAHPPNWRQESLDIDRSVAMCITTIAEWEPHGCPVHLEYSESARYSLAFGIGYTGAQAAAPMEG